MTKRSLIWQLAGAVEAADQCIGIQSGCVTEPAQATQNGVASAPVAVLDPPDTTAGALHSTPTESVTLDELRCVTAQPLPAALLSQFRAAVYNFRILLDQAQPVEERIQNGRKYLTANLKDQQSLAWLGEIFAKPLADVGAGVTLMALESRVKATQPPMLSAIKLLRELRLELARIYSQLGWELLQRCDIEAHIRRALSLDDSWHVCTACFEMNQGKCECEGEKC